MKLYGQEDTEDMVIDLKNILEDIDRAEETGCALVELRYSYNRNFKVQHSRQYRALKTAINLLSMITEKNLDTTLRNIVYQVVMAEHEAQFYATTTPKNVDTDIANWYPNIETKNLYKRVLNSFYGVGVEARTKALTEEVQSINKKLDELSNKLRSTSETTQKKGKWVDLWGSCICNNCWHTEQHHTNFCSNCGARMEASGDDK